MTNQTSSPRRLLVLGGYGVATGGLIEAAVQDPTWSVVTAGRRAAPKTLFSGAPTPHHLRVDLLDRDAVRAAFDGLIDITDVVFGAYLERADPIESVTVNTTLLRNALEGLIEAGARPGHVTLITGAKSYGPHLGAYKTPAKESDPRIMGPLFYSDQEDLLADWARRTNAAWTVLRPDGVFGPSLGSPMNLVNGLGVFAAISKELGLPLRFPGSAATWSSLVQATDTDILGRAALWSLRAPDARGQIFNVVNGDQFRWKHIWADLAEAFDMTTAEPQPMSLSVQMADKGPVWDRIVKRHGLASTPYEQIASWPFLDAVLNLPFDMVQSTIKIRQAGFADCIDSHQSLTRQLSRLRAAKLLP
uniref:PRISE-like Rossmann-fold domain-containing protein n=1 Tax=Caulobacter sp. (strain K31) TaxID=366602 RepID=B0T985_CAUSK